MRKTLRAIAMPKQVFLANLATTVTADFLDGSYSFVWLCGEPRFIEPFLIDSSDIKFPVELVEPVQVGNKNTYVLESKFYGNSWLFVPTCQAVEIMQGSLDQSTPSIKPVNLADAIQFVPSKERPELLDSLRGIGVVFDSSKNFTLNTSPLTRLVEALSLAKREGVCCINLPSLHGETSYTKEDGCNMLAILFKDYLTVGLISLLSGYDGTLILQAFEK